MSRLPGLILPADERFAAPAAERFDRDYDEELDYDEEREERAEHEERWERDERDRDWDRFDDEDE